MNILIIGAGNMGLAYAQKIAKNKAYKVHILLKEHSPKINLLKQNSEFVLHTKAAALKEAEVVLIAVKPQQSEELFKQIKSFVNENQIFISVMAGVKIKKIQEALAVTKIVRAMPNMPSRLGKGMTGFMASNAIYENELKIIKNILSSTGKVLQVFCEEAIDKVTGISGSGPAYVFYFLAAMMESAQKFGFDAQQSKMLVTQTFQGALAQFKNTDEDLETLINKVASKGGTTRAALNSFEKSKVAQGIQEGIQACYKRALELGASE